MPGLRIKAALDKNRYEKAIVVLDEQFASHSGARSWYAGGVS
jgi:hypothetical protein